MNKYVKYILIVALVSAVSFGLHVGWIAIVEPIMESNGIAFGGIIGTGDIISAVFIYVIHIVAAIVLALMFKGDMPIGICCLYNVVGYYCRYSHALRSCWVVWRGDAGALWRYLYMFTLFGCWKILLRLPFWAK